eukprot:10306421-Ditylum_brightwellii.AAC.1
MPANHNDSSISDEYSDLLSEEPRFEHPLIAGCQCFRVDRIEAFGETSEGIPFEEIFEKKLVEDTRLLGDSRIPQESDARRKFFSKKKNLEDLAPYFNGYP